MPLNPPVTRTRLPRRFIELRSGALVALEYALEPVEVHAVFPAGPRPSAKVRVFAEYLATALSGGSLPIVASTIS
jgi:hypothetical protein